MITCKKDLMNTYIENDFGELRKAYIDKAIELGYVHKWDTVRSYGWYDFPYIGINRNLSLDFIGQTSDATRGIRDTKSKLLTLSDLKPTPTKFVKVEESIFDLKGEFERGELYSSYCEGHYTQLKCEKKLYLAAHQDSVYRKVEIDWRDEVVSFLDDENIGSGGEMTGDILNALLEVDWCYIKESDFIGLCHLVASLTEKPEGV